MPVINAQPNNAIYPSTVGDSGLSNGVPSSAVNLTPNQADRFTKQSKQENSLELESQSQSKVSPWVWAAGGLLAVGGLVLTGWAWWKKKNTESVSKVATDTVTTAIGEHWDNPHVLAWFNVAKTNEYAYTIPENTVEPEAVKQFSDIARRHLSNIQVAPNGKNYKMTLEQTTLSFPWLLSNQPATIVDETMKQNFAKLYDYFQTDRVAFFKSYGKVAGIEFIDLSNTKQPETFGTLISFLQPIRYGAERYTAIQKLQREHPNIKKMVIGHGLGKEETNDWHIHGGPYDNQNVFDFIDQQTQAGEEVAAMVCQTGLISTGNPVGNKPLNLKLITHGQRRRNKLWNI
jgi:hypothetical protein